MGFPDGTVRNKFKAGVYIYTRLYSQPFFHRTELTETKSWIR